MRFNDQHPAFRVDLDNEQQLVSQRVNGDGGLFSAVQAETTERENSESLETLTGFTEEYLFHCVHNKNNNDFPLKKQNALTG